MTGTHHISLTSHINHITHQIIPTHQTQHHTHAHQPQATPNTVTMPLGNKSSIIKVNAWVSTLAPSPHHTSPHLSVSHSHDSQKVLQLLPQI